MELPWFVCGGFGFAAGVFATMGLAWGIWRRSPARKILWFAIKDHKDAEGDG